MADQAPAFAAAWLLRFGMSSIDESDTGDLGEATARLAQPVPGPTAPRPGTDRGALDRVTHALDELQRLADLLAVEDGYKPAERDFVVPQDFKLSIVIPVFNEERTIQQLLARVAAVPLSKEIIIIDDGSTDGTRQILSQYECACDVHIVFKPKNEGKGAALRTAFRRVTGDVVVVQDADLEYDPRDILALVRPIIDGQADVVYGSRFLTKGQGSRLHRWGNGLLTAASNWTTGLKVTDMEVGYKAFRRAVVNSFEIRQLRFGFEPEVTSKIARRKYRVIEVPVHYAARSYADGKKIGLADLFNAIWCILRYWWFD
jgi:glycosyltransferase involved in cell wall biosynthesis